jgi:spermidine synthase
MKNWLADAQINTDRNLRLQYLAGQGLNLYQSDPIYKAMSRQSKYPDGLFTGSAETLQALRARIDASLGGSQGF